MNATTLRTFARYLTTGRPDLWPTIESAEATLKRWTSDLNDGDSISTGGFRLELEDGETTLSRLLVTEFSDGDVFVWKG